VVARPQEKVPSRRQAVKVHCGAISEEEYPDVGRVVFTPTGVRTSEERDH
jgi:hypothetical protein